MKNTEKQFSSTRVKSQVTLKLQQNYIYLFHHEHSVLTVFDKFDQSIYRSEILCA